jgi:hypothetical protein
LRGAETPNAASISFGDSKADRVQLTSCAFASRDSIQPGRT